MASAIEDILSDSLESNPAGVRLVGRSAGFLEALREARRVARCRLPVLILGESGSGKEGIARAIHRGGERRAAPFLAVNCAALPEPLLETELFGAERGAYTGADRDRIGLYRLADGGTLFLDEIGDMPLVMQAKLLRVLQDGRVRPVGGAREHTADVRIVAATHRDLGELIARRRFRPDLYYRLAVVEIRVPPLRERLEDLPALADHFLSRLRAETGIGPSPLDESALALLRRHRWPGNVRELEAVLARALLRSEGRTITAVDVRIALEPPPHVARVTGSEWLERDWIEAALHETGGNMTRTAVRIGWSRQKLYRRVKALGIPLPGRDQEPASLGTGSTSSSSSTFQ